jgi:GrpB-like predicted nucleotidyltransferase (UPF0157 family)
MSRQARYPSGRVVAADPAWPTRYAALSADLGRRLGRDWVLEHVGSTSVSGLAAKPVIDIAIRVPDGLSVEDADEPLALAGWSAVAPVGDHWATFLVVDGVRSAIGHLFHGGQWQEAHVRLFAQWLRDHDEDRDAYERLKRSLVDRGVWGSAYTDAKGGFVADVVNRARAGRGLAPAVGGAG